MQEQFLINICKIISSLWKNRIHRIITLMKENFATGERIEVHCI
jgi:hypothetical protein